MSRKEASHMAESEYTIGVLALQGAFAEHEHILKELHIRCREIRQAKDLAEPVDGLILPGGESTVQAKLLRESGLLQPLQQQINDGLPVMGTCAGLILLAQESSGRKQPALSTLPVRVRRNAYGRQLGSFACDGTFANLGTVPLRFIRAPYIEEILDSSVQVLQETGKHITAVRCKNQLAMSFHPELTDDLRIHQYFLRMIQESR